MCSDEAHRILTLSLEKNPRDPDDREGGQHRHSNYLPGLQNLTPRVYELPALIHIEQQHLLVDIQSTLWETNIAGDHLNSDKAQESQLEPKAFLMTCACRCPIFKTHQLSQHQLQIKTQRLTFEWQYSCSSDLIQTGINPKPQCIN